MKHFFRKTLSLLLVVSLLTLPAAASEALGDDLTAKDISLNHGTQLSGNVFWSNTFSDLRRENFITYTPNGSVTPIVTAGEVVTQRRTVSSVAADLEESGFRVVAGINGDFYTTSSGVPVGLVVTEGRLRSSDGGFHAIGFRSDGTAVLGKPGITVTADLGYSLEDGFGDLIRQEHRVAAINKGRDNDGIYLYTHDFNDRHTTGTTQPGVDVICTITGGTLAIGETVSLTVEQVAETASATPVGENQMVLSANLHADILTVEALRNTPVGSTVTLTLTAADPVWNEVDYALGALYSLVENGEVVPGLEAGAAPRTAVGQKADGTLVFYTIDGRKSGHSVGASLTQVAKRLIELGCVTALCLDGGGSTTLAVTTPDSMTAAVVNRPSDGWERSVTNQIFLVANSRASGRLSHFYVDPAQSFVLAGGKVDIAASAVDTNYLPLRYQYSLTASAGTLAGSVLTTPAEGGDITVTASGGGKQGSAVVHAIQTPDTLNILSDDGATLTELTVIPGAKTDLNASASWKHLPLQADQEQFTWAVEGGVGTVDAAGVFSATAPGKGTITVSAGGQSASIPVTVSRVTLKTVEDFEAAIPPYDGINAALRHNRSADYVRYGKGSVRLDYDATAGSAQIPLAFQVPSGYSGLSFWVYGDGSGNTLSLETIVTDEQGSLITVATEAVILSFTGWEQVFVPVPKNLVTVSGLRLHGPAYLNENEETAYAAGSSGAIYLDQFVATFPGVSDTRPPVITLTADPETPEALIGTVEDAMDGMLAQSSISVTWDGKPTAFVYDSRTGTFSVPVLSDGGPHRVTVTAADASGNIGRASYDLPVAEEWTHRFTDTEGYWAANFVDFLYSANITTGYADGTFRPNQNITRAQFAVMLYRYLGLDESQYADVVLPFADLAQIGEFALPAIRVLYTEGIINGSVGSDGRLYFNPNNSLTRAQAATMIGRTQSRGYASAELTFADAASIPAYARFYIQTMAAQGVINGYADGTFLPNNPITRGQMAKILYNLM